MFLRPAASLVSTALSQATLIMLTVIRNNGLAPGGINFDAKLRRESTDVEDLVREGRRWCGVLHCMFLLRLLCFSCLGRAAHSLRLFPFSPSLLQVIAHIIGMDTFARGLRNAAKLLEDGLLSELIQKRYSSWDTDLGRAIEVRVWRPAGAAMLSVSCLVLSCLVSLPLPVVANRALLWAARRRALQEGQETLESLEARVLGGVCPSTAESSKQELADMILSYYV